MAFYQPPSGAAVDLGLSGSYTPADGASVALNIFPLPSIQPGLYRIVGASYGSATPKRAEVAVPHSDPPHKRPEPSFPWGEGETLATETSAPFSNPEKRRVEPALPWEQGENRRHEASDGWADVPKRRTIHAAAWEAGDHRCHETAAGHNDAPRRRIERAVAFEPARNFRTELSSGFRFPARHRPHFALPWDQFRLVRWEERWGKTGDATLVWTLAGAGDPARAGDAVALPMQCKWIDWPGYAVWLFLKDNPCPPFAVQRTWILMNTLSVVRASDSRPIPVMGASMEIDYDAWAWGVSLTLPDRETLALISPTNGPVDVLITANGYTWAVSVESYDHRRQFGKNGFTVQGRSRSAFLAAPYAVPRAYEETEARNAQQLAESELNNLAWTLDWSTVDWLVPGGAYSYQGRTPIDAIAAIANAVGARVQTDRSADVLHVLPRYPVSPWEWDDATPSATITADLFREYSESWQEKPAFNGVYVSGQNKGVLVNVTRTGSDGNPAAQMVVDQLITHVDAGRERGRNILAAGGKQSAVTLELPLIPYPDPPGLLLPGSLVAVDDGLTTWRGLVTGCGIEAGRPSIKQRVRIERHYP